mgnify:CR=1 FL=1
MTSTWKEIRIQSIKDYVIERWDGDVGYGFEPDEDIKIMEMVEDLEIVMPTDDKGFDMAIEWLAGHLEQFKKEFIEFLPELNQILRKKELKVLEDMNFLKRFMPDNDAWNNVEVDGINKDTRF